ncbi:hypothetical protein FOA52_010873 [Chlamydomonas sp. UWO 241]|nr:hypothetical protein FOA52_010873 [Chlamydomonas sp. UWO 241]
MAASKVVVSVKWGKVTFKDVEVDLTSSPMVFKSQLFALSSVPPDRQKVMIKGALLKDDDWGKAVPKDGATVMLMGSADAVSVAAPADAMVFMEDLPEGEQNSLETKAYGSGLENLGNTCYMNSTVQCLYAVEPLRASLSQYTGAGGFDLGTKLTKATAELFGDLSKGGESFAPYSFLTTLREKFPQFAQQGQGGYSQQDAEECWTQLIYALKEKLKGGPGEDLDDVMGVKTRLKLKCEETGEEINETAISYMLKCNIDANTNHVHEGLVLALKEDREKRSEILGRDALYQGSSVITSLPAYLTVQMFRFFYKASVQQKAKILRKVSFQLDLDVFDLCSPELKASLEGPRAALRAARDAEIELAKAAKRKNAKNEAADAAAKAAPGTAAAAAAAAPAAVPVADDAEMADAAGPSSSAAAPGVHVGALTGKYELVSCLTHKGRSADSGHYTAWVRHADGRWVLFDDDTLTFKKDEDILALSGGGDWHMAYLLLYRAVRVPAAPAAAPSAP